MRILIVILAIVLSSCVDGNLFDLNHKDIQLSINPKLPKDSNGYYYFELYSTQLQNIHTVTGSIRVNGGIPNSPREKVEWESSLYWVLRQGETIGTIYRRTWRGLGWQVVDSIKVTNLKEAIVPTINSACYNSSDGSINTVIAPMWNMKGDTMVIVARCEEAVTSVKIILK